MFRDWFSFMVFLDLILMQNSSKKKKNFDSTCSIQIYTHFTWYYSQPFIWIGRKFDKMLICTICMWIRIATVGHTIANKDNFMWHYLLFCVQCTCQTCMVMARGTVWFTAKRQLYHLSTPTAVCILIVEFTWYCVQMWKCAFLMCEYNNWTMSIVTSRMTSNNL